MNRFKLILQDKTFVKKTLAITTPIALQNLLNNLVNLVDTLMIGNLGESTVAAVGLANKVFFVFSLLLFGVCSGSMVLASQYWGKKELMNVRRVLHLSIIIGVAGSFLFLIPSVFFPEFVMSIFTPTQGTIAIGAVYLCIVAISYPLTAISNAYAAILRSMNYVKLPVIITTIAIFVNVIFNYLLIFGKYGFPKWGVAGAALATLIARVVECVALLIVIYRHKAGDGAVGDFIHTKYEKAKENGVAFINKPFVMKFLKTTSPVIANEFIWGLGVTIYSLVYGRMGDESVAAITIASSVEQVALVLFFGMCSAAAVILGNELGANNLKRAEEYAKNFIVIILTLSTLGAILTFFLRGPIISIFDVSELVHGYINRILLIFCLVTPIRMLNALFIVAIFRSGGDTFASLLLDGVAVWAVGIPMAFVGGMILKQPIYIVYAMVMLEEAFKLIFSVIRYRQKKWIKNIVATK